MINHILNLNYTQHPLRVGDFRGDLHNVEVIFKAVAVVEAVINFRLRIDGFISQLLYYPLVTTKS